MRPKGSWAQLQQRRHDAVAMLKRGMKPTDVAKSLRVSLVSVGRWRETARIGGVGALAAKPHPGRPPKLTPAQRRHLARLLRRGPIRHGYSTQLWTLERVAEVIGRTFGVSYHPSGAWWVLRRSLGWSCQRPQTRARERDDQAIERWRRIDWPRIKKRVQERQKRPVFG